MQTAVLSCALAWLKQKHSLIPKPLRGISAQGRFCFKHLDVNVSWLILAHTHKSHNFFIHLTYFINGSHVHLSFSPSGRQQNESSMAIVLLRSADSALQHVEKMELETLFEKVLRHDLQAG